MNHELTAQPLDRLRTQLFGANSVAVVGASTNPEKLGFQILDNLLQGGFEGAVYPVNPKADTILGLPVCAQVSDIPQGLDLVVAVVAAPMVPDVLRQAAAKGAGAGIIISGGFREAGRQDLEREILAVVAETGMRIIGPNCQGVNYRPNRLCASWPLVSASGSMAVISQSGTVAATLAGWAVDEGRGISATVSLGNQIDVCETDLIEFFAQDEGTRVMALYLEGAKDGRRFLEAARHATASKPVVVLKSGRSQAGQRAAASHTSSLAGSDAIFGAACRQYGIVRVPDVQSLYDSAKAIETLDLDGGNRLMVITSSGGCGILAADDAEEAGLVIPRLPEAAVEGLRAAGLLPTAILSNPLDLTVAPAGDFEAAALAAERHDVADIYLLVFGDPITGASHAAQALTQHLGRRIAVAYLGGGDVERAERLLLHAAGIPVFPTPQRAVRAIGNALSVVHYRSRRAVHGREYMGLGKS